MSVILSLLGLAFTHPNELRAVISYKLWRDPITDIKAIPEESGWNRERMRDCWGFLDLTSRSFAAVIKELRGELGRVICLFYLVLRALDTVEDDMTIPVQKKIGLLTTFHERLEQQGWNFNESGPNEKDRQLLVEFDKVIDEYQLLAPGYRVVIKDITAKMGAGMASYIAASATSPLSVAKWPDYDLYCHFVAGLVGEGLSRLFSESGLERPWLGNQLLLSNDMGLFLQKTNIIRDYAEDCLEGRFFWPRECWAKPGADFASQADVAGGIVETYAGSNRYRAEGELGDRGMFVLSSMLLDAISHSTRALDYLALLREQSIFNFCAIPQVMAIATIDAMVANPDVLRRNVKIRKSMAVKLILHSVNPRDVSYMFRDFARSIHKKISPKDPNFLKWSVELSRIEVWCETNYPSFITASSKGETPDSRAAGLNTWAQSRRELARIKERNAGDPAAVARAAAAAARDPRAAWTQEEKDAQDKKDKDSMTFFFAVVLGVLTLIILIIGLLAWFAAWYLTQEEQDPLSLWFVHFVRTARVQVVEYLAEGRKMLGELAGGVKEARGVKTEF